jgi:hypothetical protein
MDPQSRRGDTRATEPRSLGGSRCSRVSTRRRRATFGAGRRSSTRLARDGGGFELSAGGVVGADGAIVRFEGPTALEVARHAPHRLLEHLADFTGSEMSELLPCERCTVLMISPVEKHCVKMRTESQVTRRALHRRQRSSLAPPLHRTPAVAFADAYDIRISRPRM